MLVARAGRWWFAVALGAAACGDTGSSAEAGESTADTNTNSSTAPTTGDTTISTSSEPATSVDSSDADASTTVNEPTWEVVLEADESVGALFSVWGPSADHVYVVGGQQGRGISTGAMFVRDAGTWSPAALPESTPKLNWIHGTGALRVAVGERGAVLVRDGDDDAVAWSTASCSTVLPLWGTWAIAEDDVWVVGGDGFDRPPVLCHFDGAAWAAVELPAIDVDAKALFKVFATAADDVWAVGDVGLLLHYDGAAWAQVPLDTPADMISVWGTGPTDLLAVGGRGSGVLARYDGSAWTVATLESPGLNGVWMDAAGEAHAVGIMGSLLRVGAGSLDPEVVPPPTLLTLHAVWSPGDGTFVAVGGDLELPPPFIGVIVERN